MNRIAESVLIYYKNSEINRIIIITIIIYDLCFVIFRNGFRFGFSVFVVILGLALEGVTSPRTSSSNLT